MSVASGWTVLAGAQITASINDPPGGLDPGVTLGARVEIPVTRAIVSYYQRAALSGGIWTVTLDGIPEPGFFNFVWRTDDAEPPDYEVFIPIAIASSIAAGSGAGGVDYPPVDLAEVTPTVDDVAQLERTRTFDEYGNELITFTDETRPTADEVLRVITDSVPIVMGSLPTVFDPAHWPKARSLIAIYCAMVIEGSWFKEQALARGLTVMPWESEYNAAQKALEDTINEDRAQNNLLGMMEPRQPDLRGAAGMSVTVDTSKTVAMFDRLERNTDRVPGVVQRAAHEVVGSITGIPVGDTGDLAASPRVELHGNDEARVVSSITYARYVFGGTKYMSAQPPHVGYDAHRFAHDIGVEVFK